MGLFKKLFGNYDQRASDELVLAAISGDQQKARDALAQRADPEYVGIGGMSALDYACKNGHSDVIRIILEHGANTETRTSRGATAFHTAALFGKSDSVRLLLEKGAKVNAKDNAGWTPLHFASKNGDSNIADILIQNGADVNAQTKMGQTPLHLYPTDDHVSDDSEAIDELAGILGTSSQYAKSRMADIEDKIFGMSPEQRGKINYKELIATLLKGGANPRVKDNNNLTPYQLAKLNNRPNIVKFMQESGISD